MKGCWTCRRRRLVCDGGVPYCRKCKMNGVECLGYVKPLTWIGGAASRGHLKDWKLKDGSKAYNAGHLDYLHRFDSLGSVYGTIGKSSTQCYPPILSCLIEPVLKDLDYDSRLLLDFFDKRICRSFVLLDGDENPYRALLSVVDGSVGVLNGVKAIAACYMIHAITGVLAFSPQGSNSHGKTRLSQSQTMQSFGIPVNTLLGYLTKFKAIALQYLAKVIGDPTEHSERSLLATLLLLLILEMWESGGGDWNLHIEGAKTLLQHWRKSNHFIRGTETWKLLHVLIMLETFGGTLLLPGALTKPLRLLLSNSPTAVPPDVSMTGCPHEVACAIDLVTSKRQQYTSSPESTINFEIESRHSDKSLDVDIDSLETSLHSLESFDVNDWAGKIMCTSVNPSTLSLRDFAHLGNLWKTAAIMYSKRVLGGLKKERPRLQHLVNEVISIHSHVGHLHDVNKVMLWIVFVVGAESITQEQRQWASKMLEELWNIHLCANVRNAALVLRNQWEEMDRAQARSGKLQPEPWDWTNEISLLNGSWLFF